MFRNALHNNVMLGFMVLALQDPPYVAAPICALTLDNRTFGSVAKKHKISLSSLTLEYKV
jgi:hypothetical protein